MPPRRPVCLICLIFLFALYILTGRGAPAPSWDVDGASGMSVTVSGTIADRQEKNGTLQIFLTDVSFISRKDQPDRTYFPQTSKGMVVKLADASTLSGYVRIGSRAEARGVFAPFERPRCEGMFDARSYYMIRGYEGQLVRARLTGVSARYGLIRENLRKVRDIATQILEDNMSPEDAGLVAAMTLGDRTGLDTGIKELYQNAGISHVLALSGLHIASVGLAIFSLLKRSRLPEKPASVVAFMLIFAYAVMTGLSTSTQRAMIMFGLFVASRLFGRTYDLLSAASVSAVVILLLNPLYVYDTGFLLSFGAILGIACIYPVLERFVMLLPERISKNRVFMRISRGIMVSVSVTASTLPAMGKSFMQISVYSVLINLIVIPLMGLVLLTGFAGMTVGFCGPDPGPILTITHYILWLFGHLGEFFEKIPGNILLIGNPGNVQIITYAIIVIMAVAASNITCGNNNLITYLRKSIDRTGRTIPNKTAGYLKKSENKITYSIESASERRKKEFKKTVFSIITAVMIFAAFPLLMIRSRYDLEIRNIDVGQGDCALISGKDIPAVMIDGGSSDIKEVAKNRIMPVLKANRIPYVRYCFLTHMDSDHVCAVIEMLENGTSGVRIGNIVLSDASLSEAEACDNLTKLLTAAKKRGTGIITMSAGDMIRLGDMKITCLSPGKGGVLSAVKGAGTDANENSLVLRVEFQSFSAMFTGDIGEGTERSIRRAVSDCDYLKVAHHGSRNSTSDDFLALASPEISVISAGVDNSYGHPHKETLSRLAGSGTRIYITAQSGETITVIDDGRVSVSTMLGDK